MGVKYHVEGMIKIEYTYWVNEDVEAESEDNAIDAITEDFLPGDENSSEYDSFGVKVTLIEDEEMPEDRRMRADRQPVTAVE